MFGLVGDELDEAGEDGLDAETGLGRALEVLDLEISGKGFRLGLGDGPLRAHVGLVPHQQRDDGVVGVGFDLVHPGLDVVEALEVSDVEHQENALGPSVVCRGDCPELFLSGGVPQLHTDRHPLRLHSADLEIHAQCADVSLLEHIL